MRCDISAGLMQRLSPLGMEAADRQVERDWAVCGFAYCFNGLRESPVASLGAEKDPRRADVVHARVSMWKGLQATRKQFLAYHCPENLTSPFDVLRRCGELRDVLHARFLRLVRSRVHGELRN